MAAAAAGDDVQSPELAPDIVSRGRILSATDAKHDHDKEWSTAGEGILTRLLGPAESALSEHGFVAAYSKQSEDRTRFTNADIRLQSQYFVLFYPRTASWSPGFVFEPFGPGVKWLTVHDAGSSHPGQRPCLTWNLVDTASRTRDKASKPVYCRLPNVFFSAQDIGVNPTYVDKLVMYGFSRYTAADVNEAAGVSKPYNPQKDGGKVKCKVLVKMRVSPDAAFAWYDLTDTDTTSRPQSFSVAVASAKWKVLNTNTGYFMGNLNSKALFTPTEKPIKVSAATLAKLIGDMMSVIGSSPWAMQFHPGGAHAMEGARWLDAWSTGAAEDVPDKMPILNESGDTLENWQGMDRNAPSLFTGSPQDENKRQSATFTPGPEGISPEAILDAMKVKIRRVRFLIDDQFSKLLTELDNYGKDLEAAFPMAYNEVKPPNKDAVTTNLTNYLKHISAQVTNAYDVVRNDVDGRVAAAEIATSMDVLKPIHDTLVEQVVMLMPQKTSLFISGSKLAVGFQLARTATKVYSIAPSPRDAIAKINTSARYGMRGGGKASDMLDAFAIALRLPIAVAVEDPMFLQLVSMMARKDAVEPSDDGAGGDRNALLDFKEMELTPDSPGIKDTIPKTRMLLDTINAPRKMRDGSLGDKSLFRKWLEMKSIWMPGVRSDLLMTTLGEDYDRELLKEITRSASLDESDTENDKRDEISLKAIIASAVVDPPPLTPADESSEAALLKQYFVAYGSRLPPGPLDARYWGVIQESAAAAGPAASLLGVMGMYGHHPKHDGRSAMDIHRAPQRPASAALKRGDSVATLPGDAYAGAPATPGPRGRGGNRTRRRRKLPKLL